MAKQSKFPSLFYRHLGFFEYTVIVILILAIGAGAYLLLPKRKYATVTVRIENRELLYSSYGAPQSIDTVQYIPGLEGKDAFGRLESKILTVDSFPMASDRLYGRQQSVYVTLQVAANYNAKRGTYKFRGTTMQIGDWLRADVGPVTVEGVITDINKTFIKSERKTIRIKALLKREDPLLGSEFGNTTGVDPYIADGIVVGDTMNDGEGKTIATIVEKSVVPARTIVTDLYGNIFERPNPRKVDVALTLDMAVQKIGGTFYFLSGEPVKVNSKIPLFLSAIDIEPRVTEILTK